MATYRLARKAFFSETSRDHHLNCSLCALNNAFNRELAAFFIETQYLWGNWKFS